MSTLTEFFCWWIIDEPTGERRLTRFKLSRAHAQRAFPGAEPDLERGGPGNLNTAMSGDSAL
jgi:hypothetical protein